MYVKSWCFGLETGYAGKQQCSLLLVLWASWSHTASRWRTPNSTPMYWFDRFKECQQANKDYNLRRQTGDRVRFHRAQQKDCPKNSVKVSCQQVSIRHFPIPCKACMFYQVLNKDSVFTVFHWQNQKYALTKMSGLYFLPFQSKQVTYLGFIDFDFLFVWCSSGELSQLPHDTGFSTDPTSVSHNIYCICETQMFIAHETKPQLYPTQYEWWYF